MPAVLKARFVISSRCAVTIPSGQVINKLFDTIRKWCWMFYPSPIQDVRGTGPLKNIIIVDGAPLDRLLAYLEDAFV
ncbi:hypothetical protein HNY73_009318 [Argiope bruennichi]|uniref:Uncharacterized protein n=1 Tax=Argiope bruennichi TaxID=94029 RepID=A0A8T0FA58_ARGBR|nr:hypothetical protein HNY73_009318 [Argiope bruennichi]